MSYIEVGTATAEEKKEFVSLYLPARMAKELKEIKDGEKLEQELIAYVEKTRKHFRDEVSSLDEDVLMYKAKVIKAKQALREAYDEYTSASYQMWDDTQDKIKSAREFAESAVETLKPFKDELEEVNRLMDKVNHWRIETILELLQKLASADKQSQEMLRFLFENFKREEQPAK